MWLGITLCSEVACLFTNRTLSQSSCSPRLSSRESVSVNSCPDNKLPQTQWLQIMVIHLAHESMRLESVCVCVWATLLTSAGFPHLSGDCGKWATRLSCCSRLASVCSCANCGSIRAQPPSYGYDYVKSANISLAKASHMTKTLRNAKSSGKWHRWNIFPFI